MEVDLWSELAPNYPLRCDYQDPVADEETKFFEGMKWTRFNQTHWHIPILAVVIYLSMLFYLKRTMATRAPIRRAPAPKHSAPPSPPPLPSLPHPPPPDPRIRLTPLVICWNLMLSAFSFAGLFYTVPKLLNGPAGLLNHGWYVLASLILRIPPDASQCITTHPESHTPNHTRQITPPKSHKSP